MSTMVAQTIQEPVVIMLIGTTPQFLELAAFRAPPAPKCAF